MSEHSRFGGSSASRWLHCAGSTALIAAAPRAPSSKYADEGTLAHDFAAWALSEGERDIVQHVGMTLDAEVGAIALTDEMARAVQIYLDAVWAEHDRHPGAYLFVEERFEFVMEAAVPGEVFGRNDAMVYHPKAGRLVVFDYKHGAGVFVSEDNNEQLKFYAAGAVFSHDDWTVREVVTTIVQPRIHDAEPVREWKFELTELLEFKQQCEEAIELSELVGRHGPPHVSNFRVGSWCRWCDAAPFCPAKAKQVLYALDFHPEQQPDIVDMNAEHLTDPKAMDTERLAKIVAGLAVLNAWANQCQQILEGLVLAGIPVPGWKAVDKVGRSKWIEDEEVIAGELEFTYGIDEALVRPKKLTTISDVEKLMKSFGADKAAIAAFKLRTTRKESSGVTIAPESDSRPAVDVLATAFDGVNVSDE